VVVTWRSPCAQQVAITLAKQGVGAKLLPNTNVSTNLGFGSEESGCHLALAMRAAGGNHLAKQGVGAKLLPNTSVWTKLGFGSEVSGCHRASAMRAAGGNHLAKQGVGAWLRPCMSVDQTCL